MYRKQSVKVAADFIVLEVYTFSTMSCNCIHNLQECRCMYRKQSVKVAADFIVLEVYTYLQYNVCNCIHNLWNADVLYRKQSLIVFSLTSLYCFEEKLALCIKTLLCT